MKNIIIITGHNNYATGIYSSLVMISGNTESVYAIDFLSTDTDVTLAAKFLEVIKNRPDTGILFACDLLGGTPYKEAAKLAFNSPNIRVVTGSNLGGIIDSNFKLKMLDLDALANNLITSSIKNIMLLDTNSIALKDEKNGI